MKKLTTHEFIKRAILVHGDKFVYTDTNYKTSKERVTIVCKLHGVFQQFPSAHLKGTGCTYCGNELRANNCRSTTAIFITKSNMLHNNKYKYDNTDYVTAMTKVYITCSTHGDFLQRPHDHLQGSGCPKCANIATEYNRFIYYKDTKTQFYIIKYNDLYKVGITTKTVNERYMFEVDNVLDIQTIFIRYFNCYEDAYKHEQYIIKLNKQFAYNGPTIFNRTFNSEVFTELVPESFL